MLLGFATIFGPHLYTNLNSLPNETPLELALMQNNHHSLRMVVIYSINKHPVSDHWLSNADMGANTKSHNPCSVDFTLFLGGRDGQ